MTNNEHDILAMLASERFAFQVAADEYTLELLAKTFPKQIHYRQRERCAWSPSRRDFL